MKKLASQMLNSEQEDEECDATKIIVAMKLATKKVEQIVSNKGCI